MKIYLVHSSKSNFREELYQPLKHSELNKLHTIVYLYDETDNPGSTKELIRGCDLIIAEVSNNSIACGIEIGWANAFGKKIIFIHKSEIQPSRFLPIISENIISYSNSIELIDKLMNAIG